MIRHLCFVLLGLFSLNAFAENNKWVASPAIVSYIMEDELPTVNIPKNIQITRSGTSNTLLWEGNDNGTYKIEESVNNRDYQFLATTTEKSHVIEAPKGSRYRYRVSACLSLGQEEVCSLWSAPSDIVGEIAAPESIAASAGHDSITINISSNNTYFNPVFYKVEYRLNEESWQPHSPQENSSFDYSPTFSGNYRFRAYACVNAETQICSSVSPESNVTPIDVTPEAPVLLVNHGQYNVINAHWSPVDNAIEYHLQVYATHNGLDLVYEGTTSDTSIRFNDSLPRGNFLTFWVRACAKKTSKCSIWSNQTGTTPLLWGPPQAPSASIGTGPDPVRVYLDWTSVPQATNYSWQVNDYGHTVYHSDRIEENSASLAKPLIDASCPMFQVQACNAEDQCSLFSDKVYIADVSCDLQPPPNPLTLSTTSNSFIQGKPIGLEWTMSEHYTKEVFFKLFEQVDGQAQEVGNANIQSLSIDDYKIKKYGSVKFTVQACDAKNGCRTSGKSLFLQVEKGVATISFTEAEVFAGESVRLEWSVPDGVQCNSPELNKTVINDGSEMVIFYQLVAETTTWNCSGPEIDNYTITADIIVNRLPSPQNLSTGQ